MRFSYHGCSDSPGFRWFAGALRSVLEDDGHTFVRDPNDASLVLNFFREDEPVSFRRRAQAVFVIGITRARAPFDRPIRRGYPLLIRSLSNLLVALVGEDSRPDAHFLTLEQGHYVVEWTGDPARYLRHIYRRIEPLATSRLVLDNIFEPDLEEELREGDEVTRSLTRAGRLLGELDLLPAPFPIEEVLSPRDLRHVERLYGIGGLSYGNLSARKDERRFWMSASGVDKSHLREIGRDILLVTGYDSERNAILLSVPPDIEPRRVSVDAIEHWMIYREHPEVGAVVHVHAWMEGIPSTEINYPCGTYELGRAVAQVIREAEDPARAVVGLKNHGLTITGPSLDEIFERIEGRLLRQVPMS